MRGQFPLLDVQGLALHLPSTTGGVVDDGVVDASILICGWSVVELLNRQWGKRATSIIGRRGCGS